jgi:hypothetical protein
MMINFKLPSNEPEVTGEKEEPEAGCEASPGCRNGFASDVAKHASMLARLQHHYERHMV